MTKAELEYFARPGRATDLSDYSELIDALPSDPRALAQVVRGLILHEGVAALQGLSFSAERHADRNRVGAAVTYRQGAWIDHWVAEYWGADGWMLIDPDSGRDSLTRDDFRDGGTAWLRCRAGESDPFRYGNHVLWGWDELRGSLVNDLGALNKVEIGSWSWCELLKVEPIDQPNATLDPLMDAVAPAVSDGRSVEELGRAFRRDVRLQPPVTLLYKGA